MHAIIRERLLDLNPWLRDPTLFDVEVARRLPEVFIPRQIDVTGFGEPRRAKLIVGPRQAGKSTFVWSWLDGVEAKRVLFLNGEEPLIQEWSRSAAGVLRDLEEEFPAATTLFIDEAQHIENAGLFVKGLVDAGRELNILVTGSSSFHLLDRARESLAGRAERRVLLPLSLAEIAAHQPSDIPAVRRSDEEQIADRMMAFGGYPGVWSSDEPRRELRNLVEAFIFRDASDLFRIRRIDAFRRLLQLAATQIGQMANFSEWAAILGVSATTVRQYLSLLEETWVIRLVPAFAGGRRREITTAQRLHFFDMGIRNAILGVLDTDISRRPDRGALAEGFVFGELVKSLTRDWSVHYWRAKGGAEVDFVAVWGDRRIAVEVKAGHRSRLSRSARSFIEAYNPEAFIIVSGDYRAPRQERVGETTVYRSEPAELSSTVAMVVD